MYPFLKIVLTNSSFVLSIEDFGSELILRYADWSLDNCWTLLAWFFFSINTVKLSLPAFKTRICPFRVRNCFFNVIKTRFVYVFVERFKKVQFFHKHISNLFRPIQSVYQLDKKNRLEEWTKRSKKFLLNFEIDMHYKKSRPTVRRA